MGLKNILKLKLNYIAIYFIEGSCCEIYSFLLKFIFAFYFQNLPYDKIKIDKDITIYNVLETPDDSDVEYIVEVDIEFPKEIHSKLEEIQPAPEILTPDDSWMSEYKQERKKKNDIKSKSPKLIPHLMKHNKYLIISL